MSHNLTNGHISLTFHKQLEELGLSKNEALVYVAVLELGEPMVGDIETQTGLHKQLIYNAATKLETLGLMTISYLRQRRRFVAADPSTIEKQLKEKLAKAHLLVTELYEVANRKREPDQTRMFRGTRAIHQYYNQQIRRQPKESTISILGVNSKRYFELFQPSDAPYRNFEQERLERKVTMRLVLFGAKDQEVALNSGRKLFALRLLQEANFAPIDIVMWYDRAALLFYSSEPYLLDVVGKETVIGFQQYFQVLWKQAGPVEG